MLPPIPVRYSLSCLTLSLLSAFPALAGEVQKAKSPVGKEYIVIMKGTASVPNYPRGSRDVDVATKAGDVERGYKGARVRGVWRHAINGFSVGMTAAQAEKLAQDPQVALVEEDGYVTMNTTQNSPVWNLDRIDQPLLPLSSSYSYDVSGSGVTAYVIDTGINLDHTDLTGRAANGYSAIASSAGLPDYADCNGHGTHVAGTLGGSSYGVAKGVKLVNIRVLDCNGSGRISGVISGINWVTQNRVLPAVANMSLGGGHSPAMDLAIQNSIAAGVTYAVAAGNENQLACNTSPADVPEALTVGASDKTDKRASFSNYGSCLDLFAPGVAVVSDWIAGTSSTRSLSGTSMASPHVAGAAALYLSSHPGATPAQVATALTVNASGVVTNEGTNSPKGLLSTAFLAAEPAVPVDATPPSVALTSPTSGQNLSGNVNLEATAADNVAVSRVEFMVDDTLVGSDGTSPYSLSWNTASVLDGSHTFTAKAVDAANLSTLSSAISATVSNTVVTVPTPTQPGCVKASQLLANEGFEAGAVSWTASPVGLVSNDPALPAATGNWYARLGGAGVVGVNNLSQPVSIPVSACTATLSFRLNVLTGETTTRKIFDTLKVFMADQSRRTRIATFNNLTRTGGYVTQTIDLANFSGRTLQLVFESTEDKGGPTTFLIDDVAIKVTQ